MAEAKILRIYLDPDMRDMAQRGDFGFVSRVTRAFEGEGFRVELRKNSFEERAKSGARHGYSLFLMDDPFHEKALTMRRAYYYPFWRIEPTAKRWEFDVARKRFDPAEIDTDMANEWYRNWRRWLFKGAPDVVAFGLFEDVAACGGQVTGAVAPQSGRMQLGITPLHVPLSQQSRTTNDTPANAPSTWSRKFSSQLKEHELFLFKTSCRIW